MPLVFTNSFRDPRGVGLTRFSATASQTLTNVTDMSGAVNTAVQSTRTAAGNVRLLDVLTGTDIPSGSPIKFRAKVRSSVLLNNVSISYRPLVSSSGVNVAMATVDVPAGESYIEFSGTTHANATTSTSGFTFIHNGSTLSSTFDMTEIFIQYAPFWPTYFDGSFPDSGMLDYGWAGTVNNSVSTLTILDDAEKAIPFPYGNAVASNSKAQLSIRYRSGWSG